jgi:hypothetical protein
VIVLVPLLALLLIAGLAYWGRRFRAYGLALVPSRRLLGHAKAACRITGIEDTGSDRLVLVLEPVDEGDRLEMAVVELDDRELALETLRSWRDDHTPLAVTDWGERLVRIRRLDGPTGLTFRRVTT